MSNHELHVSPPLFFCGHQTPLKKADYVVIGIPFDMTSTFRTGARFAPSAIREASLNIETFSFRSNLDMEDLKIHDLGDLHVSGNVEVTLRRLQNILGELSKSQIPILIGGEHTITLGAFRGIGGDDATIISLDAHLDLRDEYMDLATSHTTFMRRLKEQINPREIIEIGTRAACKEELTYAEKSGIHFFTTKRIREVGWLSTIRSVQKIIKDCKQIYLTIDMDVLDPAFAPAVQNPEPDGLRIEMLLELIFNLCDDRLIGLDLVEVAPSFDNGVTAIQAAKILFEAMCKIESSRGN
ncbi:MAG: agmatinase [Candidatus Bathyarchaeota archaeon]|nr:MAG: agmatinase [Candidatus Bathyarchaeota archaeon]